MEFEKDNISSDNPFVDKLLKNLKILAYNCIVKDEYTADRAETSESLKNAEIYMACMENRVTLASFENIPEQFLREVGLPEHLIRTYYNMDCDIDVIPKDNDALNINYRYKLINKLRPWFLLNFQEKNEYYRKITGQPPLGEWGIPMRDYESYLPKGFTYSGEFVHEIGSYACRELETYGVLDIIKRDHPNAKYLDYVTAGLSIYEVRKALDFMILWLPETCDYNITEEFRHKYQERRDFMIRTSYNSAMEIESEHYHATMQLYLIIMTMVDMMAEIQSHMVKKDILDRRCIEYLFSMYGIPYFKNIPYKYQERICMNIHNLIKFKACSENFSIIAKIFGMDDVEFFKYYLIKVRKRDIHGDLIWSGDKVKKCIYNDGYVKRDVLSFNVVEDSDIVVDYPIENYISNGNHIIVTDYKSIIDYIEEDNVIRIPYDNIKDSNSIDVYFIYSTTSTKITKLEITKETTQDYIDIPEPVEGYLDNEWPVFVIKDNAPIKDTQYDIIEDEYISSNTITIPYSITFIFFYLDEEPYVYEYYKEDYDKTTELVFSKIPDSDVYSTQYLLDESRWKYYDIVISKDAWWTGKDYKNGSYDIVKNAILESEYNYMRSKYYAIGRLVEVSSNTAKLAFFYASLFDDIFLESQLTVYINSLSTTHSFNIAHLFIYMASLTQIYNGQEDIAIESVENISDKIASGFNYRASLDTAKEYIKSQHFDPNRFAIWDMIIPTEPITDIKEFMKIQSNNEEVYHYIRNQLVQAQDYREYLIWKYLYEYLMTWNFNQEYFKLSNGEVATSYTDFLREKDIVLYNSIISIKSIQDDEQRIDTISSIIDDICYILEDYMDKELSNYAFSEFAGQSTGSVLIYMMHLVEFFKSIKIVFNEKGQQLSMGSGGTKTINEDTVITYYDCYDYLSNSKHLDYVDADEELICHNTTPITETFVIKEDCVIISANGEEEIINAD